MLTKEIILDYNFAPGTSYASLCSFFSVKLLEIPPSRMGCFSRQCVATSRRYVYFVFLCGMGERE